MKFPSEVLINSILNENDDQEFGLTFVESTGWDDDGKYQYNSYIFKYKEKYYEISDSRSGSYYSDYYYDSEGWDGEVNCEEVEKKEVVTYEWKPVKKK